MRQTGLMFAIIPRRNMHMHTWRMSIALGEPTTMKLRCDMRLVCDPLFNLKSLRNAQSNHPIVICSILFEESVPQPADVSNQTLGATVCC